MQSMNISLPGPMKNFVEAEVVSGGYGTASEFIRELLREAQKRKGRARVDALLLEGLQSEANELTQADWKNLKRRLRLRSRSRKAAK